MVNLRDKTSAMVRTGILVTFLLLLSYFVQAQFTFQGQAMQMDGDCILLTPDTAYAEGIAFYSVLVDLEKPFSIGFDLFFGEKEEGADGMTFVLHNDPRGYRAFGVWGEGMGYGGFSPAFGGNRIAPSIAIEFDTYQNLRQNDPPNDHVAWLENGSSRHDLHWPEDSDDFNLEDGMLHDFNFQWDPVEKRVTVMLDGQIVANVQRDLVADIFEGQTMAIWGFTASTGRKHNLQYFCLRRVVKNTE